MGFLINLPCNGRTCSVWTKQKSCECVTKEVVLSHSIWQGDQGVILGSQFQNDYKVANWNPINWNVLSEENAGVNRVGRSARDLPITAHGLRGAVMHAAMSTEDNPACDIKMGKRSTTEHLMFLHERICVFFFFTTLQVFKSQDRGFSLASEDPDSGLHVQLPCILDYLHSNRTPAFHFQSLCSAK